MPTELQSESRADRASCSREASRLGGGGHGFCALPRRLTYRRKVGTLRHGTGVVHSPGQCSWPLHVENPPRRTLASPAGDPIGFPSLSAVSGTRFPKGSVSWTARDCSCT
jgi:hypothetical protein